MLRRSLVALAALTIAFTASACGDSGGGSAKEFCSLGNDKTLQNVDDPKVMAEALEKAKDKAPDEIKDDVEILAKASEEYAEKTEGLEPTDPGFLEASQAMATPEVQKAAENLSKFDEENCK
jgi:Skp family chaperone for outer membrane proteins